MDGGRAVSVGVDEDEVHLSPLPVESKYPQETHRNRVPLDNVDVAV